MPELLLDGGVRIGQNGLDEALLARAAATVVTLTDSQETAPEQSGAVLFEGRGYDLISSSGFMLPEVASVISEHNRWQQSDSPLGYLAANTEVSMTTGCISMLDAWRDEKGYAYVRHPEEYGVARDGKFGTRLHKLAHILRKRETDPDFVLAYGTPLDHECRRTCCAFHVAEIDPIENNRLQRVALPLERALNIGQTILAPTGYDWIDRRMVNSPDENNRIVVCTSNGPYELRQVDDAPIIQGELLDDGLLRAIKTPSKRYSSRPSRAKQPIIAKEQAVMFPKTKYRKLKSKPKAKAKTIKISNIDESFSLA